MELVFFIYCVVCFIVSWLTVAFLRKKILEGTAILEKEAKRLNKLKSLYSAPLNNEERFKKYGTGAEGNISKGVGNCLDDNKTDGRDSHD